jgi:NIMA (never in mitosis gene a)-related kinase 1/4/5
MAVAHRDVAGLLKKRGYLEIKKIGEGSFGKAILVQQGKDGAKFVCKMVDISKASAKEQREALQEGQLLASLKHPYIVRYRENFTDAGWLCILMDFCEGGDLTKQIEQARRTRSTLPEEQVLRWFTQAILALKYIHDRHILHRDLKPSNFFLSKHGSMKMGDFGIAKVLSCTIACAKTQIGTPYYLSPEVCQEKPYAWPSDIWAMGCILYELCALKVPFDAPNISGLVQKIIRGPVPIIPNTYSEFIRLLCGEMLNRTPGKRPSTDDILKRPKIQAIVRQMLDEAQVTPEVAKAACDPTALAPSPQAIAGVAKAAVPANNPACNYRQGDLVEYHSNTHQDWLPATVLNTDAAGRIIIDLKPNTWMGLEEQAKKIRPRRGGPYAANKGVPAAVARGNPSMQQRSPSADALHRPPIGSPMQQRSPSPGAPVQRCNSDNSTPRGFTPARGQAPSRANSPCPREPSPSPSPGFRGGARPPAMPAKVDNSPLRRRNPSAGAVGAAIAGA